MGNEKRGTYDFFYRVNPERTISFHDFIPNRNKTELNQECIQEKKNNNGQQGGGQKSICFGVIFKVG